MAEHDEVPVAIIGAGPAGLATAACLRRRGIESVAIDRAPAVGQSWRDRYERLHLHTPRIQSRLPYLAVPRSYGRFVARADVVNYLEAYATHHQVRTRLGVDVSRVDRAGDRWRVATSDGDVVAQAVVVATGYNAAPVIPDWPGRDGFTGRLLHAADYRVPAPFVGKDVLVVGTGNTGAEIVADLAEAGAGRVRLAIRTAPHVFPRSIGPIPTTLVAMPNEYLPPFVMDPVNRLVERTFVGDLSPYGMPTSEVGMLRQFRATDKVPVLDVGLVEQLRAGRVEPVAAVEAIDGDDVVLADGNRITPDVVIAATGYRSGLEGLVGHLGVLDDRGVPTHHNAKTPPTAPGLHFVGLANPLIGLLNAIRAGAKQTSRAIAHQLQP